MRQILDKVTFFLKKDDKSKGEQVIMAFLNMFTPREDASAIYSSSFGRNELKMWQMYFLISKILKIFRFHVRNLR